MIIVLSVMLIIASICTLFLSIRLGQKHELDIETIKKNDELRLMQAELENTVKQLNLDNNKLKYENQQLDDAIHKKRDNLSETIEQNKQISELAFNDYIDNLDNRYNQVEKEFDYKIDSLREQLSDVTMELDKMKKTRAAAHEALLKEQEVKDNKDNYRIQLSELEKRDIKILNSVKKELINERPVNMIIWQTYYSKKANDLCTRILGTKQKTGIYKITQISTNQCYIGQAKDIKERLREHMKCGLGIDTPVGNKLYKAMIENSLDDFIFEIIEECNISDLNEKEKYYIDLFQSYDYGFNSNRGINSGK